MAGTVIISGAAGNLGRAMRAIFLDAGYKVIGLVAPGEAGRPADPSILVEADLTHEETTANILGQLIREQGSIDVAVLTVGGFEMGSIAETSIQAIEKQIKLNFNTAYAIVRPLFMHMESNKKGRIFLVGSGPGMDMNKSKGMTAYGLSKSLVFRLAELLNAESAGLDIVTQVIVPTTIDTPQNRQAMPDADFTKWVKAETIARETLRRVTEPAPDNLIDF